MSTQPHLFEVDARLDIDNSLSIPYFAENR